MAKRSSSALIISPFSLFLTKRELIAFISILSLLIHHLSASPTPGDSRAHFEGFDADEDDDFAIRDGDGDVVVPSLRAAPPPISLSTLKSDSPPSDYINPNPDPDSSTKPRPTSSFDYQYWDEDEFEGIPENLNPSVPDNEVNAEADSTAYESSESKSEPKKSQEDSMARAPKKLASYSIEIVCVSFLIAFAINYFTGKKENEKLALAWASKFALKDTIFDKNFSLVGVGETEDSPLLLQEGNTVFKFYASGRRFCSGLLATMELKSRHDLISRLYNMVVPCKDVITLEAYMNDEAMDQVVFALARKKLAKSMHKEARDLQRFAGLVAPPNGRKWVTEELQVVSESKEVAGDLITDTVLDQVFGDKAFEKFGKGFISMHFSTQHSGSSRKALVFKFSLPDANHMADMARLVALVPYYIDLIGRYKLSSHARTKTEAARSKVAQEVYRELQNARQEALQKKKAEKLEEAAAKLSAESLRRKEAKERARQMKKGMPKMKMTRGS